MVTQKAKRPSRNPHRSDTIGPIVFIYDDVKLLIEASKRYKLLTAKEERALAEKIVQSRIELWQHALSYLPLTAAILDGIEGELKAACEHSKINVSLRNFCACKKAARAYRDRETKVNRQNFERQTLLVAKNVSTIDAALTVISSVRKEVEQRKPFGARGPSKTSGVFRTYLLKFDQKFAAHRAYKERFWQANIRLAIAMTRKYDHGMVAFADLLQEGLLGLMTAIERFDHKRGLRFSTYATHWIRHSLNRYSANYGRTVRWPAHAVADFYQLKKARDELCAKQAVVTIEDLHKASGMSIKKITRFLGISLGQHISMDQQIFWKTQPPPA